MKRVGVALLAALLAIVVYGGAALLGLWAAWHLFLFTVD